MIGFRRADSVMARGPRELQRTRPEICLQSVPFRNTRLATAAQAEIVHGEEETSD
jgi:hypothetical protein